MQTVIFDMDGVIVDSEPLYDDHLRRFLSEIGVSKPNALEKDLKGKNAHEAWHILIDEFKLPHKPEWLVVESRKAYLAYLQALPELPAIPGAVELIKHLHDKGYVLGLASAASPQRIKLFLTRVKARQYFSTIVSGDDTRRSKPAPDIFLLAAKKLKANPKNCVVIEDAANGVAAAKAAGMKCIAYAGSDHNTDDLSAADTIVKDFAALTRSLKNGQLPV